MHEGEIRLKDDQPVSAALGQVDRLILRGIAWLGVAVGGGQVVSFLSMLALARLLEPKQFGLVAIAAAVLGVVREMQDSGMMNALVYRRDDIERAAGSVLVFAPISGLVLYCAGFLAAPAISRVLGDAGATNVIRVLLLLLLIGSAGTAPWAILERSMHYQARAKIDLASAVVQAAVAVGLAVGGAGVWSLVAGQLSGAAVAVAIAWTMLPWRPSPRQADRTILRQLLRYGRWSGAARIVNIANASVDNIVVARLLGVTPLGFYSVAFRLADLPVSLLGSIVGRVMFPVYSMLQDDLDSVRRAYLQNLQRIALVLPPITIGLMIDAKPIVLALLGAKWLPAVTPLRILGVWALVRSFAGPSVPVFDGRGKPHLGLLFTVIDAVVLITLLLVLVPRYGLYGAAAAQAIGVTAAGVPALLLAMRMVGLSVGALARGLGPPALSSAILAATLAAITGFAESLAPALALFLLVVTGLVVYLGASAIFARHIFLPMWWSMRGTRDQATSP